MSEIYSVRGLTFYFFFKMQIFNKNSLQVFNFKFKYFNDVKDEELNKMIKK